MTFKADDERLAIALSNGLGSFEFVFDDDDVVQLLKTAIEHEGSQMAFAKHHHINRSYLNMVLNGKRPVTDAVAEALGTRPNNAPLPATLVRRGHRRFSRTHPHLAQ